MEEDTVELIDYLRVIWKRKILIIVGTLVCMVAAGVLSFMLPKVYKASVTLMVEVSKVPQEGGSRQTTPQILETYEGIIKNRAAMTQAIEKLQLDKEPYEMTLEDMDKSITVSAVKKSKLLRLTVEFPDPQLARYIANFLAEKAIEFNNAISTTGSAESKNFIKGQMEVAKAELDTVENKLLKFREKARLAELRKKLEILLSRKEEIENGLFRANVDAAENKERLIKIEEEFKKQDKTFKIRRKLVEDPAYQQSLVQMSESDIKKLFNIGMEEEVANPTYEHLEKGLVDVISALGGLYGRRDYLQAEFKKNTSELKTLQTESANKEIELQRLQRTYGLSVGTYKMFVKKFEEITIQVASRSQDLKILDPAVIPDKHFKPKKKRNVMIAGVVGLMMSLFLAFFIEYLGRVREKENDSVSKKINTGR